MSLVPHVRLNDELRDRIDAIRPSTTSRDEWVREAVREKLATCEGHAQTLADLKIRLAECRADRH